MASKAKRAGAGTPVPTSQAPPPPNVRPCSPLSPTRHSRLVEKAELQNLNDRLACYIDRVRYLETENARLTVQIQTSTETINRETSNIKQMYEHELSDARKLMDETSKEKAKMEIEAKRLWEENDELKQVYDKKCKEALHAEEAARLYESKYNDINNKYNAAISERKKAADDVKDLERQLGKLRKQFEENRFSLEEETLARVDLENTIQSLREELTFKDQVHSRELNETRSRRQVDISEIDGRLAEQYEAKLQQSLQELREQYEAQMRCNRDEIESLFDVKIKNVQNAAQRDKQALNTALEELRVTHSRNSGINARITELEQMNSSLNDRIRDLQLVLDGERARTAECEAEINRLREEMALQMQEYQDLMDIKVSLDLEIAAYDKLLRGEEQRLNITPSNAATAAGLSQSFSRAVRGTPSRRTPAAKRKRVYDETDEIVYDYAVTSSSTGDIEIAEIDPEGKYVKLHNKSDKEVAIGGWQLTRKAGENETVHKFHRSVKVDGGADVTVWSADSGVTASPGNIIMKSQKWFVGEEMRTNLINADGKEEATTERIRHQIATRSSRYRSNSGQVPQQNGQGQEKCCIM
ncbi:Lamin Dm0 [Pseudolycoriella hygida]|uniref:Lamin Dm0 n=1 Tax=Pseudolycoriella hygida TaxID=35572 RepID=A0A9Q0S891_9DIPT|nr:Lamin Dm0 [Pseudolycoriella hygida]